MKDAASIAVHELAALYRITIDDDLVPEIEAAIRAPLDGSSGHRVDPAKEERLLALPFISAHGEPGHPLVLDDCILRTQKLYDAEERIAHAIAMRLKEIDGNSIPDVEAEYAIELERFFPRITQAARSTRQGASLKSPSNHASQFSPADLERERPMASPACSRSSSNRRFVRERHPKSSPRSPSLRPRVKPLRACVRRWSRRSRRTRSAQRTREPSERRSERLSQRALRRDAPPPPWHHAAAFPPRTPLSAKSRRRGYRCR